MRQQVVIALLPLLLSIELPAQTRRFPSPASRPPSLEALKDSSSRLPVKRVVLYKTGIGYFEHSARVHGTQDLSVDFTTAQLNDVLKSVTAVDLGDGHVSSVRYNSIAPLDERLKSLRLPFGEQITQDGYLDALRGARIEVRSGSGTATGRLLSVEKLRRQRAKDDFEDVTSFSLVTDAGEMRNFELGPGTSVRIAERELNDEVERYLSLIASSRSSEVRQMSFTAAGSGDHDVFISYISEVPVWKSTYRIVFPEKDEQHPLLEGWAIVDNTIGEDWNNVDLSLVSGAPQSFVQNISQPLYARRPEVPLPKALAPTPQAHEATVEVNGRNFAQVIALAPGVSNQTGQDEAVVGALSKQAAEAESKSLGDFFQYSIKQKITIGKNQSALVPILESHIEAEKVTLWNPKSVALRALWVRNTSGQVLDAGSFNVLEGGTFSGEGVFETIHPDERRLLSYAGDAAIHVKYSSVSSQKPFSRLRIAKGIMELIEERHQTDQFTIRNADTNARVVIIESPAENGWQLASGSPQPEESSESFHRFRVPVEAGKTAELTVESIHPEQTIYELSNLDVDTVMLIVRERNVSPAIKQAFDGILGQKKKVAQLSEQIEDRKHESEQISADQNRIRENMKALKGSSEEKVLLERYVGELDSQESRLLSLRKELSALTAQENAANAELEQSIMAVNLDESF